jgi:phenylalanyl-tRNA synthetase beta chain
MKVSLNWIRYLNDKYHCAAEPAPDGAEALVEKIGAQLGAVEEVINLGERYKGIVVVKVISCQKHPNADKLKVCLVDEGQVVKNVPHNQDGHVEVVCGAPNVKAGQLVAWIPPGAAVPATFDKEPFVIEKREIRGIVSNGMLASPNELGLGDSHEGLLIIDEEVKPGAPFAQVYRLDDYIIDIENKMFTHRPDLFGQLGVAREIAGIQHQLFKSPPWYSENANITGDGRNNGLKVEIKNDVPKLVPRFCAVVIKDIKVKPSPLFIQARLASVGIRPINNIVDITNFGMMETAQPLHAYDYDKVKSGVLGARLSKKGEKLKLLGGKEITLNDGAVVITNGHKPIGLGGIMGGADTEVDNSTKNIILECATFDMNITRKTAMEYGLFTDAATRFTKNQSRRQNRAVIAKAANDVLKIAGGRISGTIVDDTHLQSREKPVKTDANFINSRLGLDLPEAEIKRLLENVEFKVTVSGHNISVSAPFWRTDIEIAEDIVEEVGRLYGYGKLPVKLPKRDLAPATRNKMVDLKDGVREILRSAGASEVLTYSFVHGDLLKKTGQDPSLAYKIVNALSPDLQYYRLSLTPSLLEKVHPNIKGGFDEFAIYEIGKGHNKNMKDKNDPDLPAEFEMLALTVASKNKNTKTSGSPFYQARSILDYLAAEIGVSLEYKPIKEEEPYQASKPFDPSRSAQVWAVQSNLPLGIVGEYKQTAVNNLKLPAYSAGFEIGIEQLLASIPDHKHYLPLNRFPELEQDMTLRSSVDLSYQALTDFLDKELEKLTNKEGIQYRLEPIDIFQKLDDKAHKHTTWRIILWNPGRTLTTQETNGLLDKVAEKVQKELKAERI